MSKKIGIITLNGYSNYGNRFQNYAVEQVLQSFGFEVETILNKTSSVRSKKRNKSPFKTLQNLAKMEKRKLISGVKNRMNYYLHKQKIDNFKRKKTELFKNFSNKYLHETNYAISIHDIPDNLNEKYDFFVTGSDQVWNPHYVRKDSSINFLTFASKEKRIAFAPSFGVSKIPGEDKDNFQRWISEMCKLSVREEEGARIINELTGRKATVLVDPTMMLDKKKWMSISNEDSKKPKGDYLLTYILGKIPKEKEKQIRRYAKDNDYTLVDLAMGSDWSDYIVGPREFIDYINSANAVFTDSFHGTIFSILFNTPFVTFKRRGTHEMNSRIDTLLTKFDFMDRLEDNISLTKTEIMDIDFSHVDKTLAKERKKTNDYLKDALQL